MNIKSEQIEYAKKLEDAIWKRRRALGHRHKSPQSRKGHLIGILGEVIYADHHKLPRPVLRDVNDDGYDFKRVTRIVDVKATGFTGGSPDLILFPSDLDKEVTHFALVQVDLKKGKAAIVAEVSREEFMDSCKEKDYGYGKRLYMRFGGVHGSN